MSPSLRWPPILKLADVKYEGRKAIVCLVGENLRETPGIAAHVFGELGDVEDSNDFAGRIGDQLDFCD